MEINITAICSPLIPFRDYSASAVELGWDAGRITWNHALEDAPDYALFTEDQCDEMRDYFKSFGAWSTEELAEMKHHELQALFLQMVAGDIRSVPSDAAQFTVQWWSDYHETAEKGVISGNMVQGSDGQVYYYCGV